MEKKSTVEAVAAESLVFESNFGGAEASATTPPNQKAAKPAAVTPAWDAAALACENMNTSDSKA